MVQATQLTPLDFRSCLSPLQAECWEPTTTVCCEVHPTGACGPSRESWVTSLSPLQGAELRCRAPGASLPAQELRRQALRGQRGSACHLSLPWPEQRRDQPWQLRDGAIVPLPLLTLRSLAGTSEKTSSGQGARVQLCHPSSLCSRLWLQNDLTLNQFPVHTLISNDPVGLGVMSLQAPTSGSQGQVDQGWTECRPKQEGAGPHLSAHTERRWHTQSCLQLCAQPHPARSSSIPEVPMGMPTLPAKPQAGRAARKDSPEPHLRVLVKTWSQSQLVSP